MESLGNSRMSSSMASEHSFALVAQLPQVYDFDAALPGQRLGQDPPPLQGIVHSGVSVVLEVVLAPNGPNGSNPSLARR